MNGTAALLDDAQRLCDELTRAVADATSLSVTSTPERDLLASSLASLYQECMTKLQATTTACEQLDAEEEARMAVDDPSELDTAALEADVASLKKEWIGNSAQLLELEEQLTQFRTMLYALLMVDSASER